MAPLPPPLFSVVVTTYNREDIVRRCVDSCLAQTLDDFEVVVVDDASSDDTVIAIERYEDPRVRVVAHEVNRGISTGRHTGTVHARGEWVVVVDSDWELYPHTLQRLRELIDALPPGVRAIRSQLRWDDGRVTPHFMPAQPIGYEGRIEWVEEEGGWDAGRCIKREVFERNPYIVDRRGAMEALWELDLARNETTLCVEEVLGKEHDDAANSYLRSVDSSLIPRLYAEAPDMLWMAETALARHGEALRRRGPRQYAIFSRFGASSAFLLGRRRLGLRLALRSLRVRPLDPMMWATVAVGIWGRRAAARGALAFRRLNAWRSSRG
jgi:glycosyltransferase involved in cell wall biosynthesis